MEHNVRRFYFMPLMINLAIPMVFGAIATFVALRAPSEWAKNMGIWELIPDWIGLSQVRIGIRIFIGFAAYLVWLRRKEIPFYSKVIVAYFLSPCLSVTWAFFFFRMHWTSVSFVFIALAVLVLVYNVYQFYRTSKLSALLMIPYLFWIGFLGYVNIVVYLRG